MSVIESNRQPIRYRFYDLRSYRYYGDLPLTGVKFGQRLNAAGSFSGAVRLGDPRVYNLGPFTASQPSRTLLIVDIAGTIVWGGIVWTRSYQRSQRTLVLGGQEAWSYFVHRMQAADYTNTWATTHTDALIIAQTVVADAVANPYSAFHDLTITRQYFEATAPGYWITASFPLNQKQTVDQIISNLAGMGYHVGFDYGIDWAYVGETPHPTLHLAYPWRGARYSASSALIDVDVAQDYTYPEDGAQQANIVHVIGSTTTDTITTSVTNTDSLTAGYPLLEAVVNYPQINNTEQMSALAAGDLATYKDPLLTPVVDANVFDMVPLGGFTLGDDVRFKVPAQVAVGRYTDERFPGGTQP